jgi:hypothetical protein
MLSSTGLEARQEPAMPDADLDLALAAFEPSPDLARKLETPRPTRRRAGPMSTSTRDADVAEATNRPRKRTR